MQSARPVFDTHATVHKRVSITCSISTKITSSAIAAALHQSPSAPRVSRKHKATKPMGPVSPLQHRMGQYQADFQNSSCCLPAPGSRLVRYRPRIARGAAEPTKEDQTRQTVSEQCRDFPAGGFEKSMMVAPCNAYRLNASNWTNSEAWYDEKMGPLIS